MSRAWMAFLGVTCVWAVACGSAAARCASSTPATATMEDRAGDTRKGLAPDLTRVVLSVDASCQVTVDLGLAQPRTEDQGVLAYLDIDGSSATGYRPWHGSDVLLVTRGAAAGGTPLRPVQGWYDPVVEDFVGPWMSVGSLAVGGFRTSVDVLGIRSSATLRVRLMSFWDGQIEEPDDADEDFAPAPARAPLVLHVVFDTGPRSAAPKVPRVRGMGRGEAIRALRRAGCPVGPSQGRISRTIRPWRVIRTAPRTGRRCAEPVTLVVSRGSGPRPPA